jgi:site-specific recombinase XerD
MQVYQSCLNGQQPTATQSPKKPVNEQKSLQWLCAQYFASAEFKQLENTTRRRRRTILEGVCCEQASDDNPKLIGTLPFATIPPRAVRRLRDRKAELPEAANGRLKALKAMFRWAVEADYMEVNPAKDVPRIRTASKGFHTWTIEEVRQFERASSNWNYAAPSIHPLTLHRPAPFGRCSLRPPACERWVAEVHAA